MVSNNLNELKTIVFTNVFKSRMEEDLAVIGVELAKFIEKYSFIYKGDIDDTMDIVKSHYKYNSGTKTFSLDFDRVLKSVSEETLDRNFNNIILNLSKNVEIANVKGGPNGDKKEEHVATDESLLNTSSDEELLPTN